MAREDTRAYLMICACAARSVSACCGFISDIRNSPKGTVAAQMGGPLLQVCSSVEATKAREGTT